MGPLSPFVMGLTYQNTILGLRKDFVNLLEIFVFAFPSLSFPTHPQECQSQRSACKLSVAVGGGEIIRTGDIWCLILPKAFL